LERDLASTLSEGRKRLLAAGKNGKPTRAVQTVADQATVPVEMTARKSERCATIKPVRGLFDKSLKSSDGRDPQHGCNNERQAPAPIGHHGTRD
jgi:hypothetical protein